MGRRSKLSEKSQAAIVTAILNGHYLAAAAAAAGVNRSTVHRWLERGRAERERRADGERADRRETRYLKFLETYEAAEYEPENKAVSVLFDVMSDEDNPPHARVRAAHIFLARRHPERWGNRLVETDELSESTDTTAAELVRAKVLAMAERSEEERNLMPAMNITFDEPAWPELADRDDIELLQSPISVAVLDAGMQSGKPSVTFRFTGPDGQPILIETSARLFCSTARAITARYPDLFED